MQPSDANGTATHRSAPSILQTFHVAVILSLSVGFADLAMAVVITPSRFSSFSSLLPPLSTCVLIMLIGYTVIWSAVTLPVRRLFRLASTPSDIVLAVFLATLLVLAALRYPILFAWNAGFVAKLCVALLLCVCMSTGAYFIAQTLMGKPAGGRVVAALFAALPWVSAEALLLVWLQEAWVKSLVSVVSVVVSLGFVAAVVVTLYTFLRLSSARRARTVNNVLLLLVVVSPALASLATPSQRTTGSQSGQATHPVRHVIFICVDTLRADAVGCYDATAAPTPHMDEFANEAVLFEKAYSPAPWTLPAMASILTGLPPSIHKATKPKTILSNTFATLAESMRDAGYYTAAVGVNPMLRPVANLSQGFAEYDFYPKPFASSSIGENVLIRLLPERFKVDLSTAELTDQAMDWLQANQGRDFFLWLHYFDPHQPYCPPAEFLHGASPPEGMTMCFDNPQSVRQGTFAPSRTQRAWIRRLYEAEVQYVDENIGRLIARLKALNMYDDALIILTSDHGEEFWEHGAYEHGHTLYDEVLRVPLMIKHPRNATRGRVQTPVCTQGLTATIQESCGIDSADDPLASRSLAAYGRETVNEPPEEPIVSTGMLYYEERECVVFNGWKYIHSLITSSEELYDVGRDPAEQGSIVLSAPERAAQARDILASHHQSAQEALAQHGDAGEEGKFDGQTLQRLRSLGYID